MVGLAFIPQTYITYNNPEHVKSLSTFFILITLIASIFLVSYSIYHRIIPMIITNISVLLNCIILIIIKIKVQMNETHDCISRL